MASTTNATKKKESLIPVEEEVTHPTEEKEPTPYTAPVSLTSYPPTYTMVMDSTVEHGIPLLLIGETGCGKTEFIRRSARQQKKSLLRINLTGQTSREDLVGKYTLIEGNTVWVNGPLTDALLKGEWILLDEINAALPEVLFLLQALLEVHNGQLGALRLVEKDGEEIIPHPDCRLFATCNPPGYLGTKDFNMATLSRFVTLWMNYVDEYTELEIVKSYHPDLETQHEDFIKKMIVFANKIRYRKSKGESHYTCSTRDVLLFSQLVVGGVDEVLAYHSSYGGKIFSPHERAKIDTIFADIFKVAAPKEFVNTEELQAQTKAQGERIVTLEKELETWNIMKKNGVVLHNS